MDSIRLREVATRAGVSTMTVSRALRGIDGVSEATRGRVVELARAMGYVPNAAARALTAANSRLVGISLPNLFNDVFAEILGGMRQTLHQAGYETIVDTTDYDLDRELDWFERMSLWRPAAAVLTGRHHRPALAERLARTPMPLMEIWDVTEAPLDLCVGVDHRAAGTDLGRYVAALGYRAPAFVGPPAGLDPRADARVEGIAEAFRAVGARALDRVAVAGASAFAAGAQGFARAMAGRRPDVVFLHNDNTAFGGLMEAARMGLDVPGDVGVAGFNRLDLTRVLPRALTTLETPRRQIGLTAAAHLLARLNGLRPAPVTRLPCRLVRGETVRPQP